MARKSINTSVMQKGSPFWRPLPLFNCGSCIEKKVILDGQQFYFSLPNTGLGENQSYQIGFQNGENISVFRLFDGETLQGFTTYYFRSTLGMAQIRTGSTFSGIEVIGNCYPIKLYRETITGGVYSYSVIEDLGELTYQVDTCDEYLQFEYFLSCEQFIPFNYNVKGGYSLQLAALNDELNFIQGDGMPNRVFSRTLDILNIRSYPMGWQEHQFIRYWMAVNTMSLLIKSGIDTYVIPIKLNEGSQWQPTAANTPYMVGTVDVVTDSSIERLCCVIEESS